LRILIDMNLSPEWASRLHQAGIDARHWSSVGAPSAPDREVFAHAREARWAVLTQDLDFAQVLFETAAEGPSTILLRLRNELGEGEYARVLAALRELAAEIAAGALIVIDEQRIRVRPLPLAKAKIENRPPPGV
jgi:predicted nuclease of predicted toxin-antitoxin system